VSNPKTTRRDALRTFGAGALAAIGTAVSSSRAEGHTGSAGDPESRGPGLARRRSQILMDGHVHREERRPAIPSEAHASAAAARASFCC
jgi:hypothetical protein